MCAIFLQLINLDISSKVLQLSSMSGYFAALMSEISTQGSITIIEDNKDIADITKANLELSNHSSIKVIQGDPVSIIDKYMDADRIIFCGAISNSFLSQVAEEAKDGTIIIAPVFNSALFPLDQDLVRIIKENNEIITESFGKVNFILLESKQMLKWTEKTQKLIFDQIAGELSEYFTETYPNQEPILRLGTKTPDFIKKELLNTNSLISKQFFKQAVMNCIEIFDTTIRYLYKKNIDENIDFSTVKSDSMIEELKKIGIIDEYNSKNLEYILDTKETLVYDPESPPNFENIARTILNQLIWFIEYIFK